MTIETVFSLLRRVLHLKKVGERNWPPLEAHLGFAFALYNLLVTWSGTPTLSIADSPCKAQNGSPKGFIAFPWKNLSFMSFGRAFGLRLQSDLRRFTEQFAYRFGNRK